MKKISILSLVLLLSATSAKAADTVTSLTIYGNSPQMWNMPYFSPYQNNFPGYAVVNFARQATFSDGLNMIQVADVPDEADPTSVMIRSMNRNLQVVEQNFISSHLNSADLIKRAVGKEIEVEKYGDSVISTKGILLDSSSGLIVKDGDKIKVINDYSSVTLPDEGGTSAGNAIKWLINSSLTGDSLFEYSYKTQGLSWSASYDVYLDGSKEDIMAKIEGWANLVNATKISIKDTNLKLVAGEVAQAGGGGVAVPMMAMAKRGMAMDMAESAPAMSEQKFSDYHIYTIDRKINLPAQSSKKIKLFTDKDAVLANKRYVFEGANGDNSVKSVITFTNDEKSRLGIPMPGGKYRVFQKDPSGAFEQVGEAVQEHKAEGEKIELTIGNSFDLKAERKQMDESQDQIRHRGKYTVRVDLSDASDDDVEVAVKEPVYQQNWELVSKTHEYKKLSSNQIEFKVPVKAKSKATLEYIVQYSW